MEMLPRIVQCSPGVSRLWITPGRGGGGEEKGEKEGKKEEERGKEGRGEEEKEVERKRKKEVP